MTRMDELALAEVVRELLVPANDILNVDVSNKRVLVRCDFNVPVTESNEVADESRVLGALPMLQSLTARGAKVVIASHFGRPEPKKQSWDDMKKDFSLAPVANLLSSLLGPAFVGLAPDCTGEETRSMAARLQPGQVLLLENTRFHAGDTHNSAEFAEQLAALCDIFVNDAFGVVHRDQGSVTGVARLVPERYPGLLLRKELQYLTQYLDAPVRPLGVVVGGAKVADKIGVLWALIEKADVILVGGRMAFTFLAGQGVSVGKTQVEEAWLEPTTRMVDAAAKAGKLLLLPHDVLVSEDLDRPAATRVVPLTPTCCSKEAPCVPSGSYGVDIGPSSAQAFARAVSSCRTIFWNGPMGRFEVPAFSEGTTTVAQAVADAGSSGAITVVGGGDSVSAVNQLRLAASITHISTGGGASLELIEGKGMPGLRALL